MRRVLITGANSGIGRAAAVRFAIAGHRCFGAFTDREPRLRYTCAWGGAELPAGRKRMSDREWVALGRAQDDEAYYEEFRRLFGLELRSSEEGGRRS